MPINPSLQRKLDSMKKEMQKIRDSHKATQSAMSDKVASDIEMLKNKKDQMLDAEQKRMKNMSNQSEQIDVTELVKAMISEAYASGGFDYEKQVNDKLKKYGRTDPDATTAGSSGDAPDAKFKHEGEEHNLEVKKDHKAMFGQIELKHDGKKWGISDRSRSKYPETAKSIEATGFLQKVNKQWDKPTGDYESDLQKGNVYHTHPDTEPIKSHYGKDRNTPYIQIGGHGFYHTGEDRAKLGSPELEGKTQLRARMKARGRDANGKRTYGALIVMGLKDAEKSHHDLDAKVQKEWIEDVLKGHKEFVAESALNPKDPHGDYKAKKKSLLDLSMNKDVDQKVVQQRTQDLEKEYSKLKESRNEADKYWDEAEEHKAEAKKHSSGSESYHHHMANHYDAMHRYHSDIGQHSAASKAADKAEDHHEKAYEASQGMKEAHKIGDKVEIIKGSDKGITGHIGEIRHGAFKGAPKTFTVFHGEKGATQVKKQHIKGLKEEAHDIVEETKCFSKGFWSGQQEEPKVNPHTEGSAEYSEYENGYMQGVMTRRRMQVESHMEFRIDHRDKLTGDHKATFAAHDAKVSDTTDKATYVKVPSHKADSFKSAMKSHGAKVELAEGRDYDDNRRGFGRREREDDEYHVPDPEIKKNKVKKEEVAANNVGGGSIAGTQGDAGKKVVMTKEPLKRKPLTKFKSYVSQEHENA